MTTDLGLRTTLAVSYQEAVEQVTAALKEQGFGVLTEIDVTATLKKKLDAEFRQYVILGACNPTLAYRALQTELDLGLLLPCNVIVYQADDGQTVVSIIDPAAMMNFVNNPELDMVASEARAKLEKVIQKLAG